MITYRLPAADGYAATDSRRPRPNTDNGTFDIVTTECLRPDGCGACDNVAKNSASFFHIIKGRSALKKNNQQEIKLKNVCSNLIIT